MSKEVEGSRFSGDAQRPLRTAKAAGGQSPPARCRASPAAGMFRGRGLWPRPRNAAAPDGRSVGRCGGGVWQVEGRPWGPPPRPAKQKSEPGAFGPGLALSGRFAPSRRPPPGFPPTLKRLPASPQGNRRWADGGMLTRGRREALGCAPAGRRRFAGPKGPQNQSWGGGQGPPPMLCARCARPPPRPGRWDFPPAKRSIHHPFSPWLPANKTSGPLPMSGPPAYFVRNQKSLPANFPPLFSKAAGGRSPQRGPERSPGDEARILTHRKAYYSASGAKTGMNSSTAERTLSGFSSWSRWPALRTMA